MTAELAKQVAALRKAQPRLIDLRGWVILEKLAAWCKGQPPTCQGSIALIRFKTGFNRNKVVAVLDGLERLKVLKRKRRYQAETVFTITLHDLNESTGSYFHSPNESTSESTTGGKESSLRNPVAAAGRSRPMATAQAGRDAPPSLTPLPPQVGDMTPVPPQAGDEEARTRARDGSAPAPAPETMSPRAAGTNPRARGTNPRARGASPRRHEARQGHEFDAPVRNGNGQPKETATMSEQASISLALDEMAKRLSASTGRDWMEIRLHMVKRWHLGLMEREKSALAAFERLVEIFERSPHQYPAMSVLSAIDYGVRAAIEGALHVVARKGPAPVTMGDLMDKLVRDYERRAA